MVWRQQWCLVPNQQSQGKRSSEHPPNYRSSRQKTIVWCLTMRGEKVAMAFILQEGTSLVKNNQTTKTTPQNHPRNFQKTPKTNHKTPKTSKKHREKLHFFLKNPTKKTKKRKNKTPPKKISKYSQKPNQKNPTNPQKPKKTKTLFLSRFFVFQEEARRARLEEERLLESMKPQTQLFFVLFFFGWGWGFKFLEKLLYRD